MGQKFCVGCGAALSEGIKFCENCGIPVEQGSPPAQPPLAEVKKPSPPAVAPAPPRSGGSGKAPVKIIAGVLIILLIAAAAVFVVLPKISGTSGGASPGSPSGTATGITTTKIPVITSSATVAQTTVPAPASDPFPNALMLRDGFPFGEGNVASEGTVYRIWVNDTYSWHNDKDNNYYVQQPKAGNKFLFVFVNVYNKGDTRGWPPTSGSIRVLYNGNVYSPDPTHYLPDKSSNQEATPVEVKEVQYFSKLFGSEYVEDYGYSHGTQTSYLYPGKSNAIDGYLIYQVPRSFTPSNGYAQIDFNGKDTGVWKLG